MGYLEINAEIIAEINEKTSSGEVVLSRRGQVLTNERRTTTLSPIGFFESRVTGEELHLAIKKYSERVNGLRSSEHVDRCVRDLATISYIADHVPSLSVEVPQVFGLLASKSGNVMGVLVEDFSKGGAERVESVYGAYGLPPGIRPHELDELTSGLSDEGLADAIFFVGQNRERRIGDFNQLLRNVSPEQERKRFPTMPIRKRIKEFTVFIDRRKHLRR